MQKIYKIGIEIAALDSAGPVFALLTKRLLGVGVQADTLTGKMTALKVAAVGAVTAMAGVGILSGVTALAKYGDQVVQAQNRLKAAGASAVDVARITKAAFNIATSTPGTTGSGNINLINEISPAFGRNYGEAISIAPGIAKDVTALDMSKMPGFSGQAGTIVKALDLMGAGIKNDKFDPAAFQQAFHDVTQFEFASGGLLSPKMLMRIAQTGGFTAQGYNFEDFLAANANLFTEQGSRAGTGLSALAMQLYGGTASAKTLMGMSHYGLIGAGGYTDDHGHYAVKPGAIYGYKDLMSKGLTAWVQGDLIPKLKSEGVNTTAGMIAALSQILGSVRAARAAMASATPAGQIMTARDSAMMKKAFGIDSYDDEMGSLSSQLKAYSAAQTTLFQTLGLAILPTAIKVLTGLNTAILGVAAWSTIHPERIKLIVQGIAALGVGLVVFGSAAVLVALASLGGIPMLISAAVAGVAAGIVLMIGHFNDLGKFLKNFLTNIPGVKPVTGVVSGIAHEVKKFVEFMGGPIPVSVPTQHKLGAYTYTTWSDQFPGSVPSPSAASQPVHIVNTAAIARAIHQGLTSAAGAMPLSSTGHNSRAGFLPPGVAHP